MSTAGLQGPEYAFGERRGFMPAAHCPLDRTGHTVHPWTNALTGSPWQHSPGPWEQAQGSAQQEDPALLTQFPCSAAPACSYRRCPSLTSAAPTPPVLASPSAMPPMPPWDNCSQSPLRGSLWLATLHPSGTMAPLKTSKPAGRGHCAQAP